MIAPTFAEIMANRDTFPTVDGQRIKIAKGETWRCTYGQATGTVRVMPAAYEGGPLRLWYSHDVDPGFGPLSFIPGAGIVLVERVA